MLALNLVQVRQNWLKFVVVECQVLWNEAWCYDKHFFDASSNILKGFGTFEDNADETNVVVCMLIVLKQKGVKK